MGEERDRTDFLREKYVLDWVKHNLVPMPLGALNPLCHKARADQAYLRYAMDAREERMPLASRAELVLAVLVTHRGSTLTDWVYLDREEPFKEFTGVTLRELEPKKKGTK